METKLEPEKGGYANNFFGMVKQPKVPTWLALDHFSMESKNR